MASVFITASNRWSALFFAQSLEMAGHTITSKWHDQPLRRTSTIPDDDKIAMADSSEQAIKESDYLLIIEDPDMVPGGKFVDAGIAIGFGVKVILVGRRENLKMYNTAVVQAADEVAVLGMLI